jgi:predicted Zn-dependent peptidase
MPDILGLPNGVQVISQPIPGLHSAAVGIWLLSGGRYQAAAQAGYAHLLEHLWFKRAGHYDAQGLARRFEAMGGYINAHTGRELAALQGWVPTHDIGELLELFVAMLLRPGFDQRDVELEREVVLQEMAMVGETPEVLEDRAIAAVWPDHPMGWPILGHAAAIAGATADTLRAYADAVIAEQGLWVVAAGACDRQSLLAACEPLAALPARVRSPQPPPRFVRAHQRRRGDAAQSHLLWVMPAPAASTPQLAVLLVANHLLGGGTSSRLFQELREQRGLVYGIESRLEIYSDAGLWLIHTACEAAQTAACRAAVAECVHRLCERGPDAEELSIARSHLQARLAVEEDDPEGQMERLAREAIYLAHHPSAQARRAELQAVTCEDIRRALQRAWAQAAAFEQTPS